MGDLVQQEARQLAPVDPMQLLAIAVDKGVNVDQLTKLMDLQERWEANNARKAFEEAMTAAKAEIKPIVKSREVDFTSQKGRTNYKYEDLALIADEVDPILSKHGLSYRYRASQDGNKVSVTCIVAHRSGHSEATTLSANNDESGNKNSIQAVGSVTTYLQRYTLKLALGLSATKDTDGFTPQDPQAIISDTQKSALYDMMAATNTVHAQFAKVCRVDDIDNLPAAKFDEAMALLQKKAKGTHK